MLVYLHDSMYIVLNIFVFNNIEKAIISFFFGDSFPGGLTPTGKKSFWWFVVVREIGTDRENNFSWWLDVDMEKQKPLG